MPYADMNMKKRHKTKNIRATIAKYLSSESSSLCILEEKIDPIIGKSFLVYHLIDIAARQHPEIIPKKKANLSIFFLTNIPRGPYDNVHLK